MWLEDGAGMNLPVHVFAAIVKRWSTRAFLPVCPDVRQKGKRGQ